MILEAGTRRFHIMPNGGRQQVWRRRIARRGDLELVETALGKLYATSDRSTLCAMSYIVVLSVEAYSSLMTATVRSLKAVGAEIVKARKALGWTQIHLAARAGVRQSTISLIETGATKVGADTLLLVLGALDLDLQIAARVRSTDDDLIALFDP